jgi:NAD(P)-dependent dehydrogenase (short-subunit alcohol dehydrogenase family)
MKGSSLFDVAGKVYVITGSTSGIGLMMARGLVEAGATVVVTSRKADRCAEVEAELSAIGSCVAIASDVSTEDGCRTLSEDVAARFDRVHVLVNNAANTWGAPLADHNTAVWNRVFDLNVAGTFHCTKFFRPMLDAASTPDDPGRVVNFSSVTALAVPEDETYSYTASKAAVLHLTKHLARRLAPKITVNCIVPGAFPSRMMKAAFETNADGIAASAPMQRAGRQDDAVGALIYLTSRASSWVTGTHLVVDGGAVSCVTSGGTE